MHVQMGARACAHMERVQPWGKPECWINGLINTCLSVENGADAPSCDNHQDGSFCFSEDPRQSFSALLFRGPPSPGGGSASKGQAISARLGEKAGWDNEPLLMTGRSGRQGPLRTNENVNVYLSRPTNAGLSVFMFPNPHPHPCSSVRSTRTLGRLVLTEVEIPLGLVFLIVREGDNEKVGFCPQNHHSVHFSSPGTPSAFPAHAEMGDPSHSASCGEGCRGPGDGAAEFWP